MERLSKKRDALKIDRATLSTEGKGLMAEVERLEEEGHSLAKQLEDLDVQVREKKTIAQTIFKASDEIEKTLAGLISKEKNLENENRFLQSEKAKLAHIYNEVSGRLGANMSALQGAIREIAFMKGEMATLIEKRSMLEDEVPMKFRDADNLDEKITATFKALKDLYNRMKAVERNVKVIYYKKEHL